MPYNGECEPECDSSPAMRRICALVLRTISASFCTAGANTQFSA